jgi:hypothetical protein
LRDNDISVRLDVHVFVRRPVLEIPGTCIRRHLRGRMYGERSAVGKLEAVVLFFKEHHASGFGCFSFKHCLRFAEIFVDAFHESAVYGRGIVGESVREDR